MFLQDDHHDFYMPRSPGERDEAARLRRMVYNVVRGRMLSATRVDIRDVANTCRCDAQAAIRVLYDLAARGRVKYTKKLGWLPVKGKAQA